MAIFGCLFAPENAQRAHIVTLECEHPAVLEAVDLLRVRHGAEVTRVPVGQDGRARVADVLAAVSERTCLVTVMLANNVTGVLQPVAEIAAAVRAQHPHVCVHTDASQAAGKVPVDMRALGVHMMTIAGHKMYAPKGVGALVVCDAHMPCQLACSIVGGGQENGRRGGTENVAYIVALGEACRISAEWVADKNQLSAQAARRDRLETALCERLGGTDKVRICARAVERLPNTSHFLVRNCDSRAALQRVGGRLAMSAGAACHSAADDAAHADTEWGPFRCSLGRSTTDSDLERALDLLVPAIEACTANEKRVRGE